MLARLQSSQLTGILKRLDNWIIWAVAGIAIGVAFGANLTAVWLVTAGLIAFVAYLHLTGPQGRKRRDAASQRAACS